MESTEVIEQLIKKYGYDFTDEHSDDIDDYIKDLIVDTIAIVKNNVGLADVIGSADYWSERCKLIEKCDAENPCDPDITLDQIEAFKNYYAFIKDRGHKDYR